MHASLQTTNVYDTHITSDVLARVPVEVGFGELQTWTSSLSYSTIKDVALSHICIRLTDDSGDPIEFIGELAWCLSLHVMVTQRNDYTTLKAIYSRSISDNTEHGELASDSTQGTEHNEGLPEGGEERREDTPKSK